MAIADNIRTKRTIVTFLRMDNFMTTHNEQRVFIAEQVDEVAKLQVFLEQHSVPGRNIPEAQYFLAGNTADDRVVIPAEIYALLRNVVSTLSRGEAVCVEPFGMRLTTQEAANLLGISRPTLIRLLERGNIPFEKVGKHRKVLLADVVSYQKTRFEEIQESLAFIGSPIFDIPTTPDDLKEARRVIAARRAAKRA